MSQAPDSLGFRAAAGRVPESTEAAVLAAQDASLPDIDPDALRAVVLLGAGAPGWSAAVAAAVANDLAAVPVSVCEYEQAPRFVGRDTLVVAVTLHSDEPETVSAADEAAARGATVVSIGASGALLDVAARHDASLVALDASLPHARAALGALVTAPLVVLDRLGLLPGVDASIDRAVRQLHRRRDELAGDGALTVTLARRIGRSIPLLYGAGAVGELAAQRWKHQCNTNAKIPAFAGAFPAVAYDDVSGWGQHGDVTRQVFTGVLLRHDHEGSRAGAWFESLGAVLDESLLSVHEVRAAGDGVLAQVLDLAYVGDLVSLRLAAQESLDPGPAPALEQI
jgi:glucose/mannose-6-phosphate isomerase